MTPPPLAILAELTHRCPLACLYCSNPLELERTAAELDTDSWRDVLRQAAALGVLHVHFSGGEPLARRDLEALVACAVEAGLYTNLITSGAPMDEARVAALAAAGLDHVQLSIQDTDDEAGDRIAGRAGAQRRKREAARLVRGAGMPLTVNAVLHRDNLPRLDAIVDYAVELGARRIELAHVQHHGWGLLNRAALLPSAAQVVEAGEVVAAARARLAGRVAIDYVPPDYFARRPKACMGGWGRRFMNVTPSGKALPCHAAESIPGLEFDDVRARPLAEIWADSAAFNRFRGVDWMPEPCRSCERATIDWGGCRCQALALTGDAAATDPACEFSPHRARLRAFATEPGPAAPARRPHRS